MKGRQWKPRYRRADRIGLIAVSAVRADDKDHDDQTNRHVETKRTSEMSGQATNAYRLDRSLGDELADVCSAALAFYAGHSSRSSRAP